MGKEILMFSDIEIVNHKFYCYKSSNFLEDVRINNVLIMYKVSIKISFWWKKL